MHQETFYMPVHKLRSFRSISGPWQALRVGTGHIEDLGLPLPSDFSCPRKEKTRIN